MPRILLLPLDERPCNFLYPALMVEKCTDVQLLLPPKELMGQQKAGLPRFCCWRNGWKKTFPAVTMR